MIKTPKKKKRSKALLFLAIFLLCIAGYYFLQVVHFFFDVRGLKGNGEIIAAEKDPEDPRTNILLLGIDARNPKERSRTDTIMILSLDNRSRQASLLSIPRDSRVAIPDRGLDKINHAHAFGGIALTIKAVEGFLEVPIHYYARINFDGFEQIIDTLGGVTIDVEPHVAEDRPQLEPGIQKLTGYQALLYVRDRSDSDIGRVKRQQKFLKAIAKESLRLKTIGKGPMLLDHLGDNLRTNMPATQMLKVARFFMNMDMDDIPQGVIPGAGEYINGVSYWIPNLEKTSELLVELGLKE